MNEKVAKCSPGALRSVGDRARSRTRKSSCVCTPLVSVLACHFLTNLHDSSSVNYFKLAIHYKWSTRALCKGSGEKGGALPLRAWRRPTLNQSLSRHLPNPLTALARADYQCCSRVESWTLPLLNQRLAVVTQSQCSSLTRM